MLNTFIEYLVQHLYGFLGFGLLSTVAALIVGYVNYRQQERFRKADSEHEKQISTVFGNEKPGLINAEANLLQIEKLNILSEEIEYGECGVGVFWKYSKLTKTLEIHGYGPMVPAMGYTSNFLDDPPDVFFKFDSLKHEVKKIVIYEGITYIEKYTFQGFDSLEEVYIGPSIKVIPPECFKDCIKLKHVFLPYDLEEIGWGAFKNCTSLLSVSFPTKLKIIGKEAFYGCSSFRRLLLITIKEVGTEAFSRSGLEKIEIHKARYIGREAFSETAALKTVAINDFKGIYGEAFKNSAVNKVTFGRGDLIISDAFEGIYKLTYI